ncbi:MAG: leucine--tRNA ligase [Candidatus Anstonellales archaeon]
MDINYAHWQSIWEKKGVYQPTAYDGKKFFLTAAFPYPNSPQHIGHARTYTTADIYARYMRMKGKNVLFPMGFHVTGTPIISMASRLAEGDPEILSIFEEVYHIPKEKALLLNDPKKLVMYFSKEIEIGMRMMGFSIDWRRKFYTDEPHFNRFIQWQFRKLSELGYIKKGIHPVPWCPKCENPLSAHDTHGDIDPHLEEVLVIKFKSSEGYFPTATYRPETIYGVTNLWVKPTATYVLCKMGEEHLFLSKKAYESLSNQLDIEKKEELPGSKLVGKKCTNPLNGKDVEVLPAAFVDEEVGTGLVMSVPAHAPYDYVALRDLNSNLTPIPVLEVEGFSSIPAKDIVEKLKIENQLSAQLKEATDILYKKEAHLGKMIIGDYNGMRAIEAKEKISLVLLSKGAAFLIHVISNSPIFCRCGTKSTVKIVKDQWFIDYGNKEWKERTLRHLMKMKIIPQSTVPDYTYTINWLKEKACTRSRGLGTNFPFDESQIIEALSDSTIYMAFYTISHLLPSYPLDKINDSLFDYIFLGKVTGNFKPDSKAEEMRREFLYWYPLDSRHSAVDLVHNHLTFFIFNHVAIFDDALLPQQIVANGFVTMNGKKMSKSMGNILPLQEAIKKWGPDVIRFSVIAGADIASDTDFSDSLANGVSSRLRYAVELAEKYLSKNNQNLPDEQTEHDLPHKWLLSRLHRRIKKAPYLYENFALRELAHELLYDSLNDVTWYLKRTKKPSLKEFFEYWTLLISPIMPHIAEELSFRFLGREKSVVTMPFPHPDDSKISDSLELGEELLINLIADIKQIIKIIGRGETAPPKKIFVYVASNWKRKLQKIAYTNKRLDLTMREATEIEELKGRLQDVSYLAKKFCSNLNSLTDKMLSAEEELSYFKSCLDFLSTEFSCTIEILLDKDAPSKHQQKASSALPNRPSIYIEL